MGQLSIQCRVLSLSLWAKNLWGTRQPTCVPQYSEQHLWLLPTRGHGIAAAVTDKSVPGHCQIFPGVPCCPQWKTNAQIREADVSPGKPSVCE